MREPIARLWSQIRHEQRRYPELIDDVSAMEARLESGPYRRQADYAGFISRLQSVFPDEQVGYFFFEDMIEDATSFLTSVCSFLGVEFDESMLREKSGEREKSPEMPGFVRQKATDLYGDQVERVKAVLGRVPTRWLA